MLTSRRADVSLTVSGSLGEATLQAAQDENVSRKAKGSVDRLNAHLFEMARGGAEVNYLASPVTGGGVSVPRFQQLFLLASMHGRKQPAEWAQFAWQILVAQRRRVVKEGKTLESDEDNLAELTRQATEFAEKRLPIMKALGIVNP